MVEVYWDQDDSGSLCISGHSPEIQIPPNIQLMDSSAPNSRRNIPSRTGPVHGIVIDPSQINNAELQ